MCCDPIPPTEWKATILGVEVEAVEITGTAAEPPAWAKFFCNGEVSVTMPVCGKRVGDEPWTLGGECCN